jgi:hypothetical protein
VESRKALLRTTEAVAITQQKGGGGLYPSLEKTIMDALSGDPKEDWVEAVVGRVIGPRRWDPSESVVDIVIERFVERGWFYEQAVAPTEEDRALLAAFAREAETLKARLKTFGTVLPHLHERLLRDVQAGIQSRTM